MMSDELQNQLEELVDEMNNYCDSDVDKFAARLSGIIEDQYDE